MKNYYHYVLLLKVRTFQSLLNLIDAQFILSLTSTIKFYRKVYFEYLRMHLYSCLIYKQ